MTGPLISSLVCLRKSSSTTGDSSVIGRERSASCISLQAPARTIHGGTSQQAAPAAEKKAHHPTSMILSPAGNR